MGSSDKKQKKEEELMKKKFASQQAALEAIATLENTDLLQKSKKRKSEGEPAAVEPAAAEAKEGKKQKKDKKDKKDKEAAAEPAPMEVDEAKKAKKDKKKKEKKEKKEKARAEVDPDSAAMNTRRRSSAADNDEAVAAKAVKNAAAKPRRASDVSDVAEAIRPNDEVIKQQAREKVEVEMGAEPIPISSFDTTPFDDRIVKKLKSQGFKVPTLIQSYSWPIVMRGDDLISIAETGSGKTLAFLLPALSLLLRDRKKYGKGPGALCMAPTRELSTQIGVVAEMVCDCVGMTTVVVNGGEAKGPQIAAFKKGVDIAVGTPGRINDLLEGGLCNLTNIRFLVLDEADRMLDMGFEPQIRKIVAPMPKTRQTLMFSATWPKDVQNMAADFLRKDPTRITIGSKKLSSNESVTQSVMVCEEFEKKKIVTKLLTQWYKEKEQTRILIFMLYKKTCNRMADDLARDGWPISCINGDKSQDARHKAVADFKSGKTPLLIATDVAARGLDIKNVQYVLNVEFPLLCEDYVHRVGRTGRAGATGTAVTLFTKQNASFARELREILKQANQKIDADFDKLADKAPATIPRKTAASKLYGDGFGRPDDAPMKPSEHVKFSD